MRHTYDARMDSAWISAHYRIEIADDLPRMVCIRCDEWVCYLTMHAHMRHGDQVQVLPPVRADSPSAHVW